MSAEKLIEELIELGAVWVGDKQCAISRLTDGESWGTGIKDDPSFWRQVESVVESHGFSCDVDDSDGNPYLEIIAH